MTLRTFYVMTRCSATAWSRMRTLYQFVLFQVLSCGRHASFVLCSDDGQMDTPLEAHMDPTW